MFTKNFFKHLLNFRCPACGEHENNKLSFRLIQASPDNQDFTLSVRCKCGKVCRATTTSFNRMPEAEQEQAIESFMAILKSR